MILFISSSELKALDRLCTIIRFCRTCVTKGDKPQTTCKPALRPIIGGGEALVTSAGSNDASAESCFIHVGGTDPKLEKPRNRFFRSLSILSRRRTVRR